MEALDRDRLEEILARIASLRIAVCGDLCLDASWVLDPAGSEVSAETDRPGEAVVRQAWTPGGAANIAANAATLGAAAVRAVGLVGADPFGRELLRLLRAARVSCRGIGVVEKDFATVAFAKRRRLGRELERIDFGFRNHPSREVQAALRARLAEARAWAEVLVFNQQVPGTLEEEEHRQALHRLLTAPGGGLVLLDSRHYPGCFPGLAGKLNEGEARLLLPPGISLPEGARRLQAESGRPLFITLGRQGILVAEDGECRRVPAVTRPGPVDPVGAGDTVSSALAAALAAGCAPLEAARFAALAAAVTVAKLERTGTVTPAEILALVGGGEGDRS